MLRVSVLEGENLIAKDNFMGGMIKGKSDPYVMVRSGGKSVQTRVIKETLNPHWDQTFEVLFTWRVLWFILEKLLPKNMI